MNIFGYNMMIGMLIAAAFNYFHAYFGPHEIVDASFALRKMQYFQYDRYFDEEAASFTFDMKADISGLINWNTNIIFLSVVCEYDSDQSTNNGVTVWD